MGKRIVFFFSFCGYVLHHAVMCIAFAFSNLIYKIERGGERKKKEEVVKGGSPYFFSFDCF